jgi:hypothetical protein
MLYFFLLLGAALVVFTHVMAQVCGLHGSANDYYADDYPQFDSVSTSRPDDL